MEFTYSKKRRYQLGFIKLFSPAIHIWYLKKRPSYLSIILNFNRKQTESIVYCTESVLYNIFPDPFSSTLYHESVSNINIKYQKIKNRTRVLFIKPFRQPSGLPDVLIELFVLSLVKSKLLAIKNYLATYEHKNIYQSEETFLKGIEIDWRSSDDDNSDKKNSTSIRLQVFLSSFSYWRWIEDYPLCLKDKNNRPDKTGSKKGNKKKSENNFNGYFANFYYSIPKYFSWEEPVYSMHFIYYMTSPPINHDEIISYYYPSTLQHLQKFSNNININIGAHFIYSLLNTLKSKESSIWALERQIRIYLVELNISSPLQKMLERVKLLRRLKLVWYFRKTKNQPSWMVLSILPVLPPDLRPIIQLEGNQIAISDLNKLYQKVLFRNRRIQKLKIGHSSNTSEEMQYAQRLLQDSVDCLIENDKGGIGPSSTNNRSLKSLSDILKGKKGRFRQNLLGKRVDYSGRSVIVVGPHLSIHECGIPKEMALELFQPFLIRSLIFQKKARTILGAKRLLQKGGDLISQLLYETIKNYPVLLNRAPTLHRLSIQSFQPRLVEGRAILLHPLVCSSFNADFDGDQMAVHIPLSYQARSEAWKLLWSQNNLLSPATGQPALMPTQDMILGWYYLTAFDPKNFYVYLLKNINKPLSIENTGKFFRAERILNFYKFRKFKNKSDVFLAYNQNKVNIHTPIWLFWNGFFEMERKDQPLLEMQLSSNGQLSSLSSQFLFYYNWYGLKTSQFIFTTTGRVILNGYLK